MIYTNEHYIRLKHVQLYERIYQIFLDHPLNDSNSSSKSTCCCVFTTSNKPTTVFWLLLGGNLYKKNKTSNPSSLVNQDFIFVAPSQISLGGCSFCPPKKRQEKKSKTWKTNLFCTRVWVLPKKGRLFYQPPKWPTKIARPEPWVLQAIWGCVFASGPGPEIRRCPPWKLTGIPWKLMVGRCKFRD